MHYLYHSIAVISLAAHIHQAYGAPVGPVNVIAEAVERAMYANTVTSHSTNNTHSD